MTVVSLCLTSTNVHVVLLVAEKRAEEGADAERETFDVAVEVALGDALMKSVLITSRQ